jgi:hypothetical protein
MRAVNPWGGAAVHSCSAVCKSLKRGPQGHPASGARPYPARCQIYARSLEVNALLPGPNLQSALFTRQKPRRRTPNRYHRVYRKKFSFSFNYPDPAFCAHGRIGTALYLLHTEKCWWRALSSGIWHRVVRWKPTDIFGGICRHHLLGDKPAWKQSSATCFHAFLLGLYFGPEDGGGMFLRNFNWPSADYTPLYPIR